MKTLYVSDLDGTLLRSDETTSEYTNSVINNLTDRGMIFSYATARSLVTAKKVTKGLRAEIPLIVYNGAFIVDNLTGEVLAANYFDESVGSVLDDLLGNQIFPIRQFEESSVTKIIDFCIIVQHGNASILIQPIA